MYNSENTKTSINKKPYSLQFLSNPLKPLLLKQTNKTNFSFITLIKKSKKKNFIKIHNKY